MERYQAIGAVETFGLVYALEEQTNGKSFRRRCYCVC